MDIDGCGKEPFHGEEHTHEHNRMSTGGKGPLHAKNTHITHNRTRKFSGNQRVQKKNKKVNGQGPPTGVIGGLSQPSA